ncbi:beta-glucosidase [Flavobacterium daejeonense]|uniref:beta-glucosidase n=1 Tax=Flavobacterium daejeonense TaxID=350893 RepID=UPI00068A897B|nr:glycoside hydrolase family 3 C-terminal domain-containing protein [Flavobacterium daejeonense]
MNSKNKFRILVLILCGINVYSQNAPQLGKDPVEKIIKAMSLEEKTTLLIGAGMSTVGTFNNGIVGVTQSIVPGAAGTTNSLAKYGIPSTVVADGPAGLRIAPTRPNDSNTYYCTAFPTGTLLASTWNTDLVTKVGESIGNEVHEYGIDILLAPGMNIQRNPLCGRNFEYYSEDPLISGKIAAAYVRGIQSNGVGTSIKHFAVNNQETNRVNTDARVSQRALREIYLKGFEIAVKESNPWNIMTALNKINGVYAPENYDLLTTILRKEWGYKGFVMTDWFAGKDAILQVHAGNDLIMPGRRSHAKLIAATAGKGVVTEAEIDANVKNILNYILKSPTFKRYKNSNKPDLGAHAKVTRASATEGIVLLKNNANTLPLTDKNVAIYGYTSYDFIAGGTGSGNVNRAYTVSLLDGLKNQNFKIDENIRAIYEKDLLIEAEKKKKALLENNGIAEVTAAPRLDEKTFNESVLLKNATENNGAIITFGRTAGEFADRNVADFTLSPNERKLLEDVCNAFHKQNKKVIVVLNIGGVIETASWKDLPDAILLVWQPGQEGGNSITDILVGRENPSAKLPMTFPVNYMDIASSANFPYDQKIEATKVLNQNSTSSNIKNFDYTLYEEDIYVGYRYFDTFDKEVSYPFGYGLSYTNFSFSKASLKIVKGKYLVSILVKNTGKVSGKEVVQLYVTAPGAGVSKPKQELKAFAKTKLLEPNEEQIITMELGLKDLASFSEKESAWITDAGNYTVSIGASSRDIKQDLKFKIRKTTLVEKVNDVLKPTHEIKVLTPEKK